MFLKSFYNNIKDASWISENAADSSTFNSTYLFWRDHLFERMIRLFVWSNTYEVPQKEIEQRLLLQGYCGIGKFKDGELTAFFGNMSGVTKYLDEKPNYIAYCPIWTNTFKIGYDLALINNNSLRNNAMELIHHYAVLLAHADVSLTMCMINHRTDDGIPVAKTEKHKQSISNMLRKRFNGEYGMLADIGDLGLEFTKVAANNADDITKLYEVREKLIKSFYADIGVRSAFEKNNNTVVNEITSDQSYLMLNINDMLEQRQYGCEEVNRLFGTNWSVKLSDELQIIREEKAGDTNEKDSL